MATSPAIFDCKQSLTSLVSHALLLTNVPFILTSDELPQLIDISFVLLCFVGSISDQKLKSDGQISVRAPKRYIQGIIIACQRKRVVVCLDCLALLTILLLLLDVATLVSTLSFPRKFFGPPLEQV